jgi:hypothetical protein
MDNATDRLIHLIKQAQEKYSNEYLVLAIPHFISKSFVTYCAMNEDLKLILEYIEFLKQKPEGVIKSSLTYSIISIYGKCFTDASKSSYPKLEPKDIFKKDENFETHNYMMEIRHQFIAHRGDTEFEVGISYMLLPKNETIDKSQIIFSQLKIVAFSDIDLNRIEKLVKFLLEILKIKIEKSAQKVHDSILHLFTPEQLGLMMIKINL